MHYSELYDFIPLFGNLLRIRSRLQQTGCFLLRSPDRNMLPDIYKTIINPLIVVSTVPVPLNNYFKTLSGKNQHQDLCIQPGSSFLL
jgi:hypothetical protein